MQPAKRTLFITAASVSTFVPVAQIVFLWITSTTSFESLLFWLLFADGCIQFTLIFLTQTGQIKSHKFEQIHWSLSLIVSLPITILLTYSGLASEFRLNTTILLLLLFRQTGKAVYTSLLFSIGILLLLPFFQGSYEFLLQSLFRPTIIAAISFLIAASIASHRKQLRRRLRSITRRSHNRPGQS